MKIGNLEIKNNLILAPMAGISDYPFRTLCRDYGCSLGYSEMISAEGLIRQSEKTYNYLYKGESESKNGNYLALQIFGEDPHSMGEASYIAQEHGADIVDVNMGCPVKKIVKTGAGSALLKEPNKIEQIVLAIKRKVRIPLTVKIRAGFGGDVNILSVSKVLYNSGVDAIIIHPRTQGQGFSGLPNWELIAKVKDTFPMTVIGNGNVSSYEDFLNIKRHTNCDAVMIGRAAMGAPWIFKSFYNKSNYLPSNEELKTIIKKHLDLNIAYYGKEVGIKISRKHIGWYTKKLTNGKYLRTKINASISYANTIALIDEFFANYKLA